MAVTLLVIMQLIAILLCALANQVTGQTTANQLAEIVPAKILVQHKTISENSDLHITCSTVGFRKEHQVYVYLCKNDTAISVKTQKKDHHDSIFMINSVGLDQSGNYSCVFSTMGYDLSKVAKRGDNVIQIQVIANFLPAVISVAGSSTVSEGDDVELRCAVSNSLQTLGDCQLIHSYLMKNESIVQVGAFNVTRMEVAFTIEGAVMRDSGHYSCVVLPSKCIQEHKQTLQGNNIVLLEVKDSLLLRVIVYCPAIILFLLLSLCLCCIDKPGCSASRKPRAATQLAKTVMVEEQQEQTEGDNLESQDEDSFSEEEEVEEQEEQEEYGSLGNDAVDCEEDCGEGVYSVADESENDYDDIDLMCAN